MCQHTATAAGTSGGDCGRRAASIRVRELPRELTFAIWQHGSEGVLLQLWVQLAGMRTVCFCAYYVLYNSRADYYHHNSRADYYHHNSRSDYYHTCIDPLQPIHT
jgi:hypothetical protein